MTASSAAKDHPLFLEGVDPWFALEKPHRRLEMVRALDRAFHHRSTGMNGTWSEPTRLILLWSSRKPIADLCGNHDMARARFSDRLLTVSIPERPTKVVATLPEGVASAVALLTELKALTSTHHGKLGPRLAKNLLIAANTDDLQLRLKIESLISTFIGQSAIDENNGVAYTAATKFGLIAAAGQLARDYGALPPQLDTDAAVLACLRLHLGDKRLPTLAERLRELASDPRTVDLGSGKKLRKVGQEARRTAIAYKRETGGAVQIIVRNKAKHVTRAFPLGEYQKSSDAAAALQVVEVEKRNGRQHKHLTVKRVLGADRKPERVLCFNVPLSGETIEFDDDGEV